MKTGIVFEGGAFRTIFSCGVMDALLDEKLMPDYMIGVSAGAAYGICYASQQRGRNLKIIKTYCNDKRYMGVNNLLNPKNRSFYGLKFAYDTIPNKLVPFDYQTYNNYKGDFFAVVTNVRTGRPEYIKVTGDDREFKVLQATCALPVLFPFIYINGTPYLDGGLSDSIPFEKAFEDGCDRVVVVLTRQHDYKKVTGKSTRSIARMYSKYPMLVKDLLLRADKYNACLARLEEYEHQGKVIVIRPHSTEGFSRLEKDLSKIQALYDDGLSQGLQYARDIRRFWSE